MAALLAVAGCSSQSDQPPPSASSTSPGALVYTGTLYSIMAPASETRPVSVGSLELCATSDVTVTGITAVATQGGLTITGWGHRPNPFAHSGGMMLAAQPQSLASFGFSSTPLPMTAGCGAPEGTNPEFAVQMSRPAGSDGALTVGLHVNYTQGGTAYTLDVPWTIGYCGTNTKPAPGVTCASPPA